MRDSDATLLAGCVLLICQVIREQPNKTVLTRRVCKAIREEVQK